MESKSTPEALTGGHAGEPFYKMQLEVANKEKAQLQERLREVETKNAYLLKSLFELSCAHPGSPSWAHMPMDIVQTLKRMSTSSEPALGFSGKGSAYRRSAPIDRALLHHQTNPGLIPHISPEYTPFRNRAELAGHSSAVYAVQFSPNGHRLASVSFDKSISIWPMDTLLDKNTKDPNTSIPDAHRGPVVAVEWTFDSARVVTGGLDQSTAEWDIEAGRNDPVARFLCNGLVNAVSVSPANDKLFFVGTSRNVVHLFDRRAPPPVAGSPWDPYTIVKNDSSVNTIHVTLDGLRFITGDHNGAIRTWDMRMIAERNHTGAGIPKPPLIDTTFNDDNHRPITHVHTSPPTSGEDYGRIMAVNSYDSYLRIYDRGSFFLKGERPELKPVHALRGVHNTHWPIKSSFFFGADYRPPGTSPAKRSQKRRNRDGPGHTGSQIAQKEGRGGSQEYESSSDDNDDQSSYHSSSEEDEDGDEEENQHSGIQETVGGPIQSSLILASGSADSKVYIFDVGGKSGSGCLLQTLEGHKDRVYSVDFHPHEPILASCSADSSIRIWHSLR